MIKVTKRNSVSEEFKPKKIKDAVLSAFRDCGEVGEVEIGIADDIAMQIADRIEGSNIVAIEDIQDLVEELLMQSNPKVAKKYILYRETKQAERRKGVFKKTTIPAEVISELKHEPSKLTPLGSFVYSRTYSRFLPALSRRETWLETCIRAVEYNTSLAETPMEEKIELLKNMYRLKQFLSGRTLWIGGTEIAQEFPLSNFNCAFEVVEKFSDFKDMFYLLMLGAGVGVRIMPKDVTKLPPVRKVKVRHMPYEVKEKSERVEYTSVIFDKFNEATVVVGDSKEGWAESIEVFFRLLSDKQYKKVTQITVDYSNIRDRGERLVRMGGTASGPQVLQKMFVQISKMIDKKPGSLVKLETIDVLDIANHIGECVVMGGVRRTAEMAMIDPEDKACIEAKSEIYKAVNGEFKVNNDLVHRQLSNNTIIFNEKPSREYLHEVIEKIKRTGEPGFLNKEAAIKRNPNFKGTNPCGEILLDSKQVCNLTTVNVMAFVEDGKLDLEELMNAQRLSARAGYRMTMLELELPEWNEKQNRDHLLGCSLTGWQDMVNACNYTKEKEVALLKLLKHAAKEAACEYAKELGTGEPLLVTTVKPEGTLSQLPTVSSGVHYSHSPYYVRRVRVSSSDPLVKVCEELGYPIHPEVGQEIETARTKVVEFPVKAPDGRTKKDATAIEQLENYIMFMDNYVDHNCSITVTVKEHEWDEVEQFIWDRWDEVVAITLLADFDSVYDLLPYEEITEEEYEQRKQDMKPFQSGLIQKYESIPSEEDLLETGCESGICPIR